ncbi:MAG: hypothetical protein ACTHXA_04825 [Gulosibacter sp.]|uniref:hypothetical protein n=1 Tax=Gulosibacter sp. TaxID=2817531 RepID=UPI003F90037B
MSAPTTNEIILALFNAVPGREDEFNSWYTDTHLPEVVRIPGFLTAQRYEIPAAMADAGLKYTYATLYEVAGAAAEAIQELHTWVFESNSDAIDHTNMIMSPFVQRGVAVRAIESSEQRPSE